MAKALYVYKCLKCGHRHENQKRAQKIRLWLCDGCYCFTKQERLNLRDKKLTSESNSMVEFHLPKVGVTGPIPASRSIIPREF